MPTHRVRAAAEGMSISRRLFLSGTAASAVAITACPASHAAESNTGALANLIERHRQAAKAVWEADEECKVRQKAFDACMKTSPVTYTTSAGVLIIHTEPLAIGTYDRAVPLAIQRAHSERQRASDKLMQAIPSVDEDRAATLARAKAIVMESREIFLTDLDARDAAAARYDALWDVDCGKAEAVADSLQDAEVELWDELCGYACTSRAASRAKAEYVLASRNLVDRLRMDELGGEPVDLTEFVASLCGVGQEAAR